MTRPAGQLFTIFISQHQYCVTQAFRPDRRRPVSEGLEKRERKLRDREWSFGQRGNRFLDLNSVHQSIQIRGEDTKSERKILLPGVPGIPRREPGDAEGATWKPRLRHPDESGQRGNAARTARLSFAPGLILDAEHLILHVSGVSRSPRKVFEPLKLF